MKQTVVSVFESPLKANEAVHVLVQARFIADRLPRIARDATPPANSRSGHAWARIRQRWRDFIDADMYLQPYAQALAKGHFVVKVYVYDAAEAAAAKAILEAAGGTGIDFVADEPVLD